MVSGELFFLFVAIPAAACAGVVTWSRLAMRRVGVRDAGFFRGPQVASKFLVYTTLFIVPTVYGLVVLTLTLPVSEAAANR